ncbi:MAG: sulfate adenylyltransferase subunit CysN [Bryobacteraceae bacterium]|nr:sulfate adenylyltransferase subunit CysN [Bryobacteraceae bacterium]
MTEKSLLRFSTAGSVDDGKSTLIGRLLYDSNGAYDDQVEAVRKSKVNRSGGDFDFSLLTDGLRAEREQGITIDVAWRYFATPKRKFIIADTPGHEQYTRNMATGASTVDLAIILIDARKGVVEQTRRHAYVSSLLGIRHLVVAVNKMDLVGFDESVFNRVRDDFDGLVEHLRRTSVRFIPLSALEGDNVTFRSPRTPWYGGPSLLEHLEEIDVDHALDQAPFRFPVQYVIRPDLDFRGFAGQIASGHVRPGDEVLVLPSGRRTRVARIVTMDGDLAEAHAPMSVTITLEDEIDLGRGGILAAAAAPPQTGRWLESSLVWMSPQKLVPGKPYILRHGPHQVTARVDRLVHRTEINTFACEDSDHLELNQIGSAIIETTQPLHFDAYSENRRTGAFILIDPISNLTLAAGMIERPAADPHDAVRARKQLTFDSYRRALIVADPDSPLPHALREAGADVLLFDARGRHHHEVLAELRSEGLL